MNLSLSAGDVTATSEAKGSPALIMTGASDLQNGGSSAVCASVIAHEGFACDVASSPRDVKNDSLEVAGWKKRANIADLGLVSFSKIIHLTSSSKEGQTPTAVETLKHTHAALNGNSKKLSLDPIVAETSSKSDRRAHIVDDDAALVGATALTVAATTTRRPASDSALPPYSKEPVPTSTTTKSKSNHGLASTQRIPLNAALAGESSKAARRSRVLEDDATLAGATNFMLAATGKQRPETYTSQSQCSPGGLVASGQEDAEKMLKKINSVRNILPDPLKRKSSHRKLALKKEEDDKEDKKDANEDPMKRRSSHRRLGVISEKERESTKSKRAPDSNALKNLRRSKSSDGIRFSQNDLVKPASAPTESDDNKRQGRRRVHRAQTQPEGYLRGQVAASAKHSQTKENGSGELNRSQRPESKRKPRITIARRNINSSQRNINSSQIRRALQSQEDKVNALPDEESDKEEEPEEEQPDATEAKDDSERKDDSDVNEIQLSRLATMFPSMPVMPMLPAMPVMPAMPQVNLPRFNITTGTGEDGANSTMSQFVPKFTFSNANNNSNGEGGTVGGTFLSTMSSFAPRLSGGATNNGEAVGASTGSTFLATMSSFAPRLPGAANYGRMGEMDNNEDVELKPDETTLDTSSSERQDGSLNDGSHSYNSGIDHSSMSFVTIDRSEDAHDLPLTPGSETCNSKHQQMQRQRRGVSRRCLVTGRSKRGMSGKSNHGIPEKTDHALTRKSNHGVSTRESNHNVSGVSTHGGSGSLRRKGSHNGANLRFSGRHQREAPGDEVSQLAA
jgi:hypothetical protein